MSRLSCLLSNKKISLTTRDNLITNTQSKNLLLKSEYINNERISLL